jgi:UPF0271 protein
VVAQAVRLATRKEILAIDGTVVPVVADSLCIHGDTPGAVSMAAAVREGLEQAGVQIEEYGENEPESEEELEVEKEPSHDVVGE